MHETIPTEIDNYTVKFMVNGKKYDTMSFEEDGKIKYIKGAEHPYYTNAITTDERNDAIEQWRAKEENQDDETPSESVIRQIVLNGRFEKLATIKVPVGATTGQGVCFDLGAGILNGYNLYLKASQADNPQARYILIDGNAAPPDDKSTGGWPFMIGTNFKVDWDGHLTCNNIEYLGAGNQTIGGKHININDRFLVNYDGSGTWWSGSVGYATKAGTAKVAESVSGLASIQAQFNSLLTEFRSHYHLLSGKPTGGPQGI